MLRSKRRSAASSDETSLHSPSDKRSQQHCAFDEAATGTLRRSSCSINLTLRHIRSRHVGGERRWIALSWIAVAAAARRAEGDRVALVHDVLLLGIGLLAVDAQLARRAVLAAFDAEGRKQSAFGEERYGDRRLASALDQNFLCQPATMAAGSARVVPKLLVMETQRRAVLADPDRGRAFVPRPG